MSRLYDINYDKEKWVINGNRDTGYQIVRKETFTSYLVGRDIIGIEQVTDDAFLVYRRTMRNEWSIARIRLTATGKVCEYEHSFKNSDFLTDDTIIFDKNSCVFATVYSINNNCEIPIIYSIISKSSNLPDARFCKSRKIDLYRNSKSLEYPSHLFVEYELSSIYCKEFI